MQRAARQWGRSLAVAACLLLPAAHAQTVSPIPVAPAADSIKPPLPTFVADTTRQVGVVAAEPTDAVTRRSALRIGAAIVVLTLTTLLLYNVRSR